MPYSDGSLRPQILEWIRRDEGPRRYRQVVDIGAGAGLNSDFFRPHLPDARWIGLEIWAPYVARFNLTAKYDQVFIADARERPIPPADLYILGDVLEHMEREDAISLWRECRSLGRSVVASLPIVHYPQGAEHGNPFEEHLYHWSTTEFVTAMPGVTDSIAGDVVGAFWAEGLQP